jgi:hypothetical protein
MVGPINKQGNVQDISLIPLLSISLEVVILSFLG